MAISLRIFVSVIPTNQFITLKSRDSMSSSHSSACHDKKYCNFRINYDDLGYLVDCSPSLQGSNFCLLNCTLYPSREGKIFLFQADNFIRRCIICEKVHVKL